MSGSILMHSQDSQWGQVQQNPSVWGATQGWEGTAGINPAINGSKPLDLQNVTPNPAAELGTPQRSVEPSGTGL